MTVKYPCFWVTQFIPSVQNSSCMFPEETNFVYKELGEVRFLLSHTKAN